jgi:Arc/MetJ-type ribon-helix-helix transcriptional regulator
MVNITVSIPEHLYEKMKRYSEVKWSEVVRKALAEYVGRLEIVERGVVPSEDLAAMLKESRLDVSSISLEKAIKCYEKARELEWKRLSSTQAHS